MPIARTTAQAAYLRLVATQSLVADAAQQAALGELDRLYATQFAARPLWTWLRAQWLQNFGVRWRTRPQQQGAYIVGGVGTGKTMLMDLFVATLPPNLVHRIHFHRFMQSTHDRRRALKSRAEPLAIIAKQLAQQFRILCLDEFTVTDITDAMILAALLENLCARGVILVTTSNTPIEDLYQGGLQRARFRPTIDLLHQYTRTLRVDRGHDYRLDFMRATTLFHTPSDPAARTKMTATFVHLHGDGMEATIDIAGQIIINDRSIRTLRVGCGVVWFDFAELCENHRSKVDYIEIARQFHSVLLADIPVLTAACDDAARRLIELVDALYDCNVNLIIAAATPPDGLYQGRRLAAPFRRTASRLHEMNSQAYLAKPHLA